METVRRPKFVKSRSADRRGGGDGDGDAVTPVRHSRTVFVKLGSAKGCTSVNER